MRINLPLFGEVLEHSMTILVLMLIIRLRSRVEFVEFPLLVAFLLESSKVMLLLGFTCTDTLEIQTHSLCILEVRLLMLEIIRCKG